MSLKEKIRTQLRRNRRWVTLRRIQREGTLNAFRRWRLWSQILNTPPFITDPVIADAPVELHILCYERDYLAAMWTLKSFYHFALVRYPLVIHLQGRANHRMLGRLKQHFPTARIVTQSEADPFVEDLLVRCGQVRLLEARRRNPFMLKLTDFPILSAATNLLTLDSDIIFFSRPVELLIGDDAPLTFSLFQRDAASTYNISIDRARDELGVDLQPCINTGIALFSRESLDLARCEGYLAHPDVARLTGWIEQTLHALCASQQERVAFLPDSYLISLERHADPTSLVARHYAGSSRPLLTEEGMAGLAATSFFSDISAIQVRDATPSEPFSESC